MMDADLLYRFYLNGVKFKYIDKDLAISRLGGVTNDRWKNKLKERKLLITGNGGSDLLANVKCIQFALYQSMKKVLYSTIGGDLTRRIKYLLLNL